MRLLTLNLRHGGAARIDRIAGYLLSQNADTLVLSEFRPNSAGAALRQQLASAGFEHQHCPGADPRGNSVLIASREPMRFDEHAAANCKRYVVGRLSNGTAICGVYFPLGEAKRPLFEHLQRQVARVLGPLAVVIGDFNTGEHRLDEAGATFVCTDAFAELKASGLVDSWRLRNPEARVFSWFSNRGNGFRVDHALHTQRLDARIASVAYDHGPRESGLSDHSALLVQYAD